MVAGHLAVSQLTIHAAKAVLAGREAPKQDEDELAAGLAAFTARRAPDFGWPASG